MRERKRQERRDAIINAAVNLFQTRGYEQTTMEEIAAGADVSAPTLYRYFPKKPQLLVAFFWKERERLDGALEAFQKESAGMEPIDAVSGLLILNNSGVRNKRVRKLWREALAALMRMHDTADDDFRSIKLYFERHLGRMLKRLQQEGRLSSDLPMSATVATLYAIAAENYYRLIANEFETLEAAETVLREQTAVVLRGWVLPYQRA
jgi:AcrR family transcriptional regulator